MISFKAKLFCIKHNINGSCTLNNLKSIIHKSGYNLCTYAEEKLKLISLKLWEEAKTAPALTVISSKNNITIYYNDTLPYIIQRFALSHELGHIALGHIKRNLNGKKQEDEADKFAEYILTKKKKDKCLSAIKTLSTIICFCLSLVFICLVNEKSIVQETQQNNTEIVSSESVETSAPTIIVNNNNSDSLDSKNLPKKENIPLPKEQQEIWEEDYIETDNAETDDITFCYFTQYGEVYHIYEDCHYIVNSNGIYYDTIENSCMERLCSACKRRQQKE